MKQLTFTLLMFFGMMSSTFAQLPDGTIAPDFTVTDINGNTHNLYSYLDAGKHVVLDFSATWCGPCWSFHQTHALRNIYNTYGPNGTDDVMVIWIEGENNNSPGCLYGACTGTPSGANSTQGNWVAGEPYPFVDLSVIGQNNLKSAYSIGFFPTLYMINHYTKKVYQRSWGIGQAGIESILFNSFEMAVSLSVDNGTGCPLTASISANVTAGAQPLTYGWSNGGSTPTISNLAAGNYTLTVTDANNIGLVSPTTTITSPPAIQTSLVSQQNVTCFGANNGGLTVSASGGNGGFSFDWSNGQNGPALVNLPGGTYTCTATDAQGCTKAMGPYTVTEPNQLVTDPNNTDPTCGINNGIVSLVATGGTPPYQYTLNNVTQNSPVFANLSGGSYNYSVVDIRGCNVSGSTVLTSSLAPVAVTSAVGAISCINTTATVSGSGSSTGSNFEYQWSTTNGNIVSGANELNAIVDQGGNYTLQVRNLSNGCVTTSSTTMAANVALPTAVVATPSNLTCTTTTLNLDGTGSSTGSTFTYLWTTTNGNITSGANTLMPTVNQAGNYNLRVTNTQNGCIKNQSTTVAANTTPPTLSLPTGLELTCGQTNLQVCATSNAATFAWSNGATQSCTSVSTPGTISLVATGTNGCTTSSSTTVAASTDLPLVQISTPGMVTCSVPTVTLQGSVSNTGTFTYLWTTANGTIVSGADTPNAVVSSAGTYNLQATNTSNGCVGNQTVTVDQISASPSAVYTAQQTGTSVTGTANTTASTTTFAWTLNGANVGNTSSVTVSIANPGTYELCLSATNDCGTNTSCTSYTVNSPLAGSSTSTNVKCFDANDGSAAAQGIGGRAPYSYAWTGPNGFASTNANISGLAPGTYTCVITDADGGSVSTTAIITQPTAMSVASQSVVDDVNNSNQGSVNISITGGTGSYTYLWSNGAVTQNLTGVGAGSYTCIVTDANGCTRTVGPIVVANLSSVDETKFVQSINVYPSPAIHAVNVIVSFTKANNASISLMNTAGQNVIVRNYTSAQINDIIEVSNLPAGVYTLAISNGEFTTMRKVIVAK